MDMNSYVVRGANGSVDADATVAKFESDLAAHIAKVEQSEARIASAMTAVFDAHKGQSITKPALTSLVLNALGSGPESFKSDSDAVAAFLKANSGEGQEYVINKGKGGGVARRSDITQKQ